MIETVREYTNSYSIAGRILSVPRLRDVGRNSVTLRASSGKTRLMAGSWWWFCLHQNFAQSAKDARCFSSLHTTAYHNRRRSCTSARKSRQSQLRPGIRYNDPVHASYPHQGCEPKRMYPGLASLYSSEGNTLSRKRYTLLEDKAIPLTR